MSHCSPTHPVRHGRIVLVFLAAIVTSACSEDLRYPWLHELDAADAVSESGERLMDLPMGLHALEAEEDAPVLLVGIHGFASRGYEWVYPLQTVDDDASAAHFYRWDYTGCPGPAADALIAAIGAQLQATPAIERVRLLGHSYGGVLVTMVMDRWGLDRPVEVHAIAAPLASIRGTTCDYETPTRVPDNVSFTQWRTQHELDGAFKDLEVDPQVIELPGARVVLLPDTYRGNRLGHNWSISWVADELVKGGEGASE